MGAKISGLIQGVRYGGDAERLWVRLIDDGIDATIDAETRVSCNIYDPSGNVLLSDEDMTQEAEDSPWWYYDLDASDSNSFAKAYNYRIEVVFYVDDLVKVDHHLFDVVPWPFNEPLLSGEEVDELHPAWAAARPSGVTTWQVPIREAHKELANDVRAMVDNRGTKVYPNRVIDRSLLREVELAYVERYIVTNTIRADAKTREFHAARALAVFKSLNELFIDVDDDLVQGDGESTFGTTVYTGPRFVR